MENSPAIQKKEASKGFGSFQNLLPMFCLLPEF